MAPNTTRLPSISEWLQGDPFPWPGIDEPAEGASYTACYCVESKQLLRTKGDKPYLRLQLADRSGTIEGRAWDDAERIDSWVRPGGYIGVRGRIQSFRNQRQLKVEEIGPIEVASDELDLFLPATNLDLDALEAALDRMIASVADRPLRQLLEQLAGAGTDTGRAFRRAPAAKRNHHAYVGGLLEHTVSITTVADSLARHYGAMIDRDLLITGAILHDIGKIQEIAVTGGFPYTDPGKLLGHILLGIEIVRDAARQIDGLDPERLILVLHLIASHQGKYEWQSPRIPHTLEAIILHFADDLDAKVNQAAALVNAVDEGWTAYDNNFGREFFRHPGTVADRLNAAIQTIPDLLDAAPMNPERGDVEAATLESAVDELVYDLATAESEEGPSKGAEEEVERRAAGPRIDAGRADDEEGGEVDRDQVSIFDLL